LTAIVTRRYAEPGAGRIPLKYRPEPIDTSGVALGDDLVAL